MRASSLTSRALLIAAGASVAVSASLLVANSAGAATCSDVDVAFARGTGEQAGLGFTGTPFVNSLKSDLAGKSVNAYAVNYAAASDQSSAGPGGTDMSNHVASVAAACPNTKFVIGGYSQGGSVTDVAVGLQSGGTAIPANLAGRVAAVVTFGNPLGMRGQTIATASKVYGPKSKDYCNTGDPVCGGGSNTAAHLQYASNGMTTAGAQFAAGLVNAAGSGGGGGTTTPTTPASPPASPPSTTPTTPPASPPASGSATCVTGAIGAHIAAGRAMNFFGLEFAKGSNQFLGFNDAAQVVSLQNTGGSAWKKVSSC